MNGSILPDGDLFARYRVWDRIMIAINQPKSDASNDHPLEPGRLVRHRRYGYRVVVVSRDAFCKANEDWYQNNQTQPARDQHWYHVLVHETSTVTYAAAENLVADTSGLPIEHPLLIHFFSEFKNGSYVRTDVPWPD